MDIKDFEPLFGNWYVESFIGSGAFGKVYKIKREEFGKVYYSALKWISIPKDEAELKQLRYDGLDNASISEYYKDVAKEINNEMHIMSRLIGRSSIVSYEDHKIVPKPNEMGYDIFIRMELLTSLNDYMQKHELSRSDLIRLGIDICDALELCQKYNIIHRDIKPDNIFVTDTGDFKLGDFGIARQLERTATGSKKGTYFYMAPEVYKGERYNSNVDIYSLGIVLYRLLNRGRFPFLPLAPEPIRPYDRDQCLVRLMSGERMSPPQNAEGRLSDIVLKACAYDAMDRYSSPRQMREELKVIQISKYDAKYVYKDGDNLGRLGSSFSEKPDSSTTILIKDNKTKNTGTSKKSTSRIEDFEPLFGDWYVDSLMRADYFCKIYKINREVTGGVICCAMKWISIPQDTAELEQMLSNGDDNASIYEFYKKTVNNLTKKMHLVSNLEGQNSIVSYEDYCVVPKSNWMGYDIFIRMELLISLDDYMHNHELSRADLMRLGINLCEALELCQKFSIIHRNINPENIFVAETGEFKLGNFENVLHIEEAEKGDPCFNAYMAPEMYKGERYYSSADLYSVGLLLYQLLNNDRLPFMPVAPAEICLSDFEQSLVRRMSGEQLPLPLKAQDRLGHIILRACSYDPKDRYPDPTQMREDLQEIRFSEENTKHVFKNGKNLKAVTSSRNSAIDTKKIIGANFNVELVDIDAVLCIDVSHDMQCIIEDVKKECIDFHNNLIAALKLHGKGVNSIRVKVIAFDDYHIDIIHAIDETNFFGLPKDDEIFREAINCIKIKYDGLPKRRLCLGLETLALAIRSEWDESNPNRKQIIAVWSRTGTHSLGLATVKKNYQFQMPEDFKELSDWWGMHNCNSRYMRKDAKWLILYAPNQPYWNRISSTWDHVVSYTGLYRDQLSEVIESICCGIGPDEQTTHKK